MSLSCMFGHSWKMSRHMEAVYADKEIVGYDYWRSHKCERCGAMKEEAHVHEVSGPLMLGSKNDRMHAALFAPFS